MTHSPLVAAIVVTHDHGHVVGKLVRSVLTAPGAEAVTIVVVDAGSSDNSVSAARQAGAQLVIEARNLGFAAAVNVALERPEVAHAPWLLLVNPDGAWVGGDWRALIRSADAPPSVAACTCRQVDAAGRLANNAGHFRSASWRLARELPGRRASQRIRTPGWYDHPHDDVDWAVGAFLLMRTDVLHALGGLDERYFLFVEDVDIGRALRDRGLRMRYLPEFTFRHIGGEMGTPFRSAHWCRSDLIYVKKWEGQTALLAARALWALRALRALIGRGGTPLSRVAAPAVLRVALGAAPPKPVSHRPSRR